jgi:hypothetical protein
MRKSAFALALVLYSSLLNGQQKQFQIELKTVSNTMMTDTIQYAIDKCAASGGGIVRFTEGTFICGGIQLKSKVCLHLNKGVILQGSDKYSDYRNDAFIYGKDLSGITIEGEGVIDGVDCYNSKGEEGFRGPHCIKLINCKDIKLEGITIKNSANWAINCRHCSNGIITNVVIRGGHDGLHTRFCDNFTVTGCDFRTGDDAFAGNDNRDFNITACLVNTSCNGFRLGCMNLTVKHCTLWGPGESIHKIQKRNNMLSAFVHFSPEDEHPKLTSGNWTIEDITVRDVDNFFMYNYKNGLWQTGQPFTSVNLNHIHAEGILNAFYISGDTARIFNMYLKNSDFTFRINTNIRDSIFEGRKLQSDDFFYANSFNNISFENVTFEKRDSSVLLKAENGNEISLYNIGFIWLSVSSPFIFNRITDVKKNIYYNKNYDLINDVDLEIP